MDATPGAKPHPVVNLFNMLQVLGLTLQAIPIAARSSLARRSGANNSDDPHGLIANLLPKHLSDTVGSVDSLLGRAREWKPAIDDAVNPGALTWSVGLVEELERVRAAAIHVTLEMQQTTPNLDAALATMSELRRAIARRLGTVSALVTLGRHERKDPEAKRTHSVFDEAEGEWKTIVIDQRGNPAGYLVLERLHGNHVRTWKGRLGQRHFEVLYEVDDIAGSPPAYYLAFRHGNPGSFELTDADYVQIFTNTEAARWLEREGMDLPDALRAVGHAPSAAGAVSADLLAKLEAVVTKSTVEINGHNQRSGVDEIRAWVAENPSARPWLCEQLNTEVRLEMAWKEQSKPIPFPDDPADSKAVRAMSPEWRLLLACAVVVALHDHDYVDPIWERPSESWGDYTKDPKALEERTYDVNAEALMRYARGLTDRHARAYLNIVKRDWQKQSHSDGVNRPSVKAAAGGAEGNATPPALPGGAVDANGPALTADHESVLAVLAKTPTKCKTVIDVASCGPIRNRETVGRLLRELEGFGQVNRPYGKHKGYALMASGKARNKTTHATT